MKYAKHQIDPLVGKQVTVVCESPTEIGRKIHVTGLLHGTFDGSYYVYLGLPGDPDQVKSFNLAEIAEYKAATDDETSFIFLA